MDLIILVLVVSLILSLVYFITSKAPGLDPFFKQLIWVIVGVVLLLYVLRHFVTIPNVLPQ